MVARCKCGLVWNISIKAQVPKDGYKCPWCRGINKKATEDTDQSGPKQHSK
ncbi:hypothetical protein [Clostridium beijerinckii]|uniref:hypothetical protein n=1 Tax=Clostridium beijerinckii TaxID=1520 RepID=UPI0009CCF2A5|nr:hypothetical protein [Clostridium beijerinckii]NRT76347.1 hypothetical protein [Clostridium beijerinckii]OOM48616.1 hypothetical protein CBEIJ_20880 [Clostridium beijerinckii]